jgi:hypothetical protein
MIARAQSSGAVAERAPRVAAIRRRVASFYDMDIHWNFTMSQKYLKNP